ncbi:MAG: radical SAM protein [Spirochaetota bacterium]|nr:radical SAM protein [Spirochaetota bacterium]
MSYAFELGPIRPPSEAMSILIRVTRNCPWNKCAFCMTYGEAFSKRSVEEVKGDIDSIHTIADRIINASYKLDYNGIINEPVLREAIGIDITPSHYYNQVAMWLYYGMKSAFLQDANSLIVKTNDLIEIVKYLKEKFPTLERVTTYARAKTLSKKSLKELKDLRNAGLSRLHIGMESGADSVLEFIQKGVTSSELISGGKKAIEAGFDLSEYYMPGLGGKEFVKENALETAQVLNEINPTFIRIRSTIPVPGTLLYQRMTEKKWTPLTEEGKVEEIRLFIESLDGITSNILSDHMMNLLEDVQGRLPEDKDKIIKVIDEFLSLSTEEKESFIIGRRLGRFRRLTDLKADPQIEQFKADIKSRYSTVDNGILELIKNFI